MKSFKHSGWHLPLRNSLANTHWSQADLSSYSHFSTLLVLWPGQVLTLSTPQLPPMWNDDPHRSSWGLSRVTKVKHSVPFLLLKMPGKCQPPSWSEVTRFFPQRQVLPGAGQKLGSMLLSYRGNFWPSSVLTIWPSPLGRKHSKLS